MKRIVIYVLILAATLFAPVKGNDIGRLRPVQAALVYKENQNVVIQTDTEDTGVGQTAKEALQNLKDTTPGIIYLDTARYLLVAEEALPEIEPLRAELKPSVQMCLAEGAVLGADTALFLKVHGQLPQLKSWKEGVDLPLLTTFEKRLILTKKDEISP